MRFEIRGLDALKTLRGGTACDWRFGDLIRGHPLLREIWGHDSLKTHGGAMLAI